MKNVEAKAVKDFDGYVGNQLMTFAKGDDLNLGFGQHKILKHAGRVGLVEKYGVEASSGDESLYEGALTSAELLANFFGYVDNFGDGTLVPDGFSLEGVNWTVQQITANGGTGVIDLGLLEDSAVIPSSITVMFGEKGPYEMPYAQGGASYVMRITDSELTAYISANVGVPITVKITSLTTQ